MEATVTSKGQVTIPLGIREKLGLKPGVKIMFEETESGFLMKTRTEALQSLKGCASYQGKVLSIDDMNEAVYLHTGKNDEPARA